MENVLRLSRRFATAAAMMITIVSQIAGAQTVGDFRPVTPASPDYPAYPGNPGYPGYNNDVVTVAVNQQFNGFSTLDVSAYFSYATQGRSIASLTIRMAAQGRAEATLLIDGAPAGRTLLSPYMQDYAFDLTRAYPGARLELRFAGGQTYVQSMTAQLAYQPYPPYPQPPYPPPHPPRPRPPHPPQPPYPPAPRQEVLTQYVNQYYNGRNVLQIDSLVGLDRYYGRRVNRVIVRMRSDRGQAQAVLITSGRRDGDAIQVSASMVDHSFFPENGRIGYEIRGLSVELRGRIAVESVTVELAR